MTKFFFAFNCFESALDAERDLQQLEAIEFAAQQAAERDALQRELDEVRHRAEDLALREKARMMSREAAKNAEPILQSMFFFLFCYFFF